MSTSSLLFRLSLPFFAALAGTAAQTATVTGPWSLRELDTPPAATWGARTGLVQELYYAGEPFAGQPTRVFAYLGRPESPAPPAAPFPAMVLVHGGGGRAFRDWAEHWAKRGYVALAMDLAGNGPNGRLADGGPDQADNVKFRNFAETDTREMWTYHAVAAVIRGHSLLRSLPEVDRDRIGITGISWGGYLTCIVAGIDPRLKVAVPVYGCGFLGRNSFWKDGVLAAMEPAARERWLQTFDPSRYLPGVRCPILFLNGTTDFAYPLDSYQASYRLVPDRYRHVAVVKDLPHGHIWTFPEVDAFVDAALRHGDRFPKTSVPHVDRDVVAVETRDPSEVQAATLCYTQDEGPWQKRTWHTAPATVEGSRVSATLPPDRPLVAFLAMTDRRGLRFSSEHVALRDPLSRSNQPPNLVVVLADDLGWGDLRSYNPQSKIPTPHLDRLAAEGLRFTDAHSPSAVCTPTRYGLLTGRYAWRTRLKSGVLWGYSPPLIEPGRSTLATFLKSHGYATAGVGKWHLGLEFATLNGQPAAFGDATEPKADPALIDWSQALRAGPRTVGFDSYFGIPASLDMTPYIYLANDRVVAAPTVQLPGDKHQRQGGGGFWRAGLAAPGFTVEACQPTLTAHAVEFLRRQSPDRPFFLYFPLTSPHDPWVPTPEFRGRSECGPRGDFIVQIDDTIGQIARALEDRGLAKDTLLVFASDNGAHWLPSEVTAARHAANGPWRGMKADAFEGGHRVPLLARWPARIKPGTTSEALVGLNDLFATVADLLEQPLPSDAAEDSVSFRDALEGRPQPPRPPLVLHSVRGTFALRDGPWKWIDGPDSGGWTATTATNAPGQLYRLDLDPAETKNLWSVEPQRVEELRRHLARLRDTTETTRVTDTAATTTSPAGPRPPNFLFILTDDLGIDDLACYGRQDHRTPHLDRLASEGIRFTSAYCAQPICSPSRAAILTGKTPARLHLTAYLPGRADAPSQPLLHPVIRRQLPLEETTLAEHLREAGYATACIGKWHLGGAGFGPAQQGFDFVHAGRANTEPSLTEGSKGEFDLTAQADAFMERHRDRPFLVYLAHNTPHIPYAARPDHVERHRAAFEPVYAAVIESLDASVGRLLERLDALGLRDNTVVIFTSDNGGLHVPELRHARVTHNSPYRAGKGYLHEGGLRVPLIVRWPGRIPGGRVTDTPVINTDWLPTLLEIAGRQLPPDLDGVSLAPFLLNRAEPSPRRFFWHAPHYTNQGGRPGGAVRDGRWKFIEFYDTDETELYDLTADPSEQRNLTPDEPRRVAEFRQALAVWRSEVGAQANAPNPGADPARFRELYVDFDPSNFDPPRATGTDWERVAAWRREMDAVVTRPRAP